MAHHDTPETRYAKCGDVNIAFQVFGTGPRDFIYVPGIVSNIELAWEDERQAGFMLALAEHFRVIIFDKRGQGMSDRISSAPSMEERMDDIRAVMEAVGSEKIPRSGCLWTRFFLLGLSPDVGNGASVCLHSSLEIGIADLNLPHLVDHRLPGSD